jgi:dinuclear metal center YbgI/SA1388 family protein
VYKVQDIISTLEDHAPLALQEDWDNCGLLVGDRQMEVSEILCTLDVTFEVVREAIDKGCNMIITHHPLIFGGLKSITGANEVERCVVEAIKHDVAIYAAHTNMDNVKNGVSGTMAQKLALKQTTIMAPQSGNLLKLEVYVPQMHVTSVRDAMFAAGAGHIGNYDSCSFITQGEGTFRALDATHPYVGEPGKLHFEKESCIEVVLPAFIQGKVVEALKKAHPYEEVAYDLFPLKNNWENVGLGMVGELETPIEEGAFLELLKSTFGVPVVRHSPLRGKMVKKIAVMGGSGASYLSSAIATGADVFVTGDTKYHEFFIPEGRIILADIGHYESEQYTKELFKEIITKKMATFAPRISDTDTNYVKYC